MTEARSAAAKPAANHPPSMLRGEIDDPKLSAALRTLELTVKRKLDGMLHGDHLGLLPGRVPSRGVAALSTRRRRPPHGLGGHRAHHGPPRARDDRRPGTGDLAGGRHVGEPGLRHHGL
ncbi:hypothetical protein I552_5780 [Mycobacterium xenopi 3993]|nr:hypothetical protein I552_5780 [Mycobacterium xenopi 3993]